MKILLSFLLVLGMFCVPSTAVARIGVIEILEIVYTDLGNTTGGRLASGRFLVTTTGMSGEGMINCNGQQDCLNAGLDGRSLDILQDLRIILDATEAGVRGRAEGRIIAVELDAGRKLQFKGKITGQVACVGRPRQPCNTLEVDLLLRARIIDADQKSLAGVLEFQLTGKLSDGNGASLPPNWTSLGGSGALGIFIDDDTDSNP